MIISTQPEIEPEMMDFVPGKAAIQVEEAQLVSINSWLYLFHGSA